MFRQNSLFITPCWVSHLRLHICKPNLQRIICWFMSQIPRQCSRWKSVINEKDKFTCRYNLAVISMNSEHFCHFLIDWEFSISIQHKICSILEACWQWFCEREHIILSPHFLKKMLFPNTHLFYIFKHVKPNMSSLSRIIILIVSFSKRSWPLQQRLAYMLIDIVS